VPSLSPAPSYSPLPWTLLNNAKISVQTATLVESQNDNAFCVGYIDLNNSSRGVFQCFNSAGIRITPRGGIGIVDTTFEIIGVAVGRSSDKDTVAFATFGVDESLVCFFTFESDDWVLLGKCTPYEGGDAEIPP